MEQLGGPSKVTATPGAQRGAHHTGRAPLLPPFLPLSTWDAQCLCTSQPWPLGSSEPGPGHEVNVGD